MLEGQMAKDSVTAEGLAPIRKLGDELWVVERPFHLWGMNPGNRMSVMRLGDGRLAVHSPVKLDDGLREGLAKLGQPAHIIAPNRFHHLHELLQKRSRFLFSCEPGRECGSCKIHHPRLGIA